MPNACTQTRVEWQSAPVEKFEMCVVPSASEAIMAKRWEMDLSPGRESTPERRPAGRIVCCMKFYCKWRIIFAGNESWSPWSRSTWQANRPMSFRFCGAGPQTRCGRPHPPFPSRSESAILSERPVWGPAADVGVRPTKAGASGESAWDRLSAVLCAVSVQTRVYRRSHFCGVQATAEKCVHFLGYRCRVRDRIAITHGQ